MRLPRLTALGVVLAACVFALAPGLLHARQLTVERLASAPSLSGAIPAGIEWAPDGRSVTFLWDSSGGNVQDLWAFDLAAARAAVLVRAADLTRGAEQQFSAEERAARERRRETALGITAYHRSAVANRLLFPLSGDLYTYDLATREVARLTRTTAAELDPKWSPDGRWVAFVRDNDVFALELATGRETQLTTGATGKIKHGVAEFIAQEEMDRHTGYWWSPDSRRVAFLETDDTKLPVYRWMNYLAPLPEVVEQEYPRAGDANTVVRLGIVPVTGGAATWLDQGANPDVYIPRVSWLPDGTLAVQRQNRNQDTLQLLFFDGATGAGRVVLTEAETTWVNLHDDFRPLAGGRQFLWTSERDGWRHIYLFERSGRLVRQLTRGAWEVERVVGVDERRRRVYFTATEQSPLERHLYVVSLDGRGLRRVSRAEGWHDPTVAPDHAHFLDRHSSAARPGGAGVYRSSGEFVGWVAENRVNELDEYGFAPPEFITVPGADGTSLHARVVKPATFDSSRKYPVLVYAYGGPQSQEVARRWGGDYYLFHQLLAQRGYVVVTVDNRGTPARGRDFARLMFRRLGQVEVADQVAAARWLAAQGWVDAGRIGIWGASYGGYTTLMALMTGGGVFKMGVAVAPVTDWREYDTHYTERYMRLPRDNAENYRSGAPLTHPASLQGRLLLIHGDADDNVHYGQTIKMVDGLLRAGKQFRFVVYPGKTHRIRTSDVRGHFWTLVRDFVLENL